MVSCRFSQQNQSNDPVILEHDFDVASTWTHSFWQDRLMLWGRQGVEFGRVWILGDSSHLSLKLEQWTRNLRLILRFLSHDFHAMVKSEGKAAMLCE